MRADLYIREEDRGALGGTGPVKLVMPKYLKCAPPSKSQIIGCCGVTRSRELADGKIVCMSCPHGPCKLPAGIGRDRELWIFKD